MVSGELLVASKNWLPITLWHFLGVLLFPWGSYYFLLIMSRSKGGYFIRVKYLGIQIDQHLNWNEHIKNIIPKLTRAIGILSKIRHYVPKFLLKTIYYSIFNSYLIYACQVWGQNEKWKMKKLSSLQNKAIRIINFKQQDFPVNEPYNANEILKMNNYIRLINFLSVQDVCQINL